MSNAQQQADWRKRRYLHGPQQLPALGTARRLQALYADGWTFIQLSSVVGLSARQLQAIAQGEAQEVLHGTALAVAACFDKLAGVRPESPYAARNRTYARRRGWAPAFAWDSIDDPHERAKGLRIA